MCPFIDKRQRGKIRDNKTRIKKLPYDIIPDKTYLRHLEIIKIIFKVFQQSFPWGFFLDKT